MFLPKSAAVRIAAEGFVLLALALALVFIVQKNASPEEILLPTLDLMPAEGEESRFLGKLVGRKGETDIHLFNTEETAKGFTAPPDAHIVFAAPDAISPGMEVDTAHGDPRMFREVRYWGYEYSGNEARNKKDGKTGRDLFDGRFWLSEGELAVTTDRYGYLNTTDADGSAMDVAPGRRYYLMLDGATLVNRAFRVSPLDDDHDLLNNAREDQNGNGVTDAGETDSRKADTDGDGVGDGAEVAAASDPLDPASPPPDDDGTGGEECEFPNHCPTISRLTCANRHRPPVSADHDTRFSADGHNTPASRTHTPSMSLSHRPQSSEQGHNPTSSANGDPHDPLQSSLHRLEISVNHAPLISVEGHDPIVSLNHNREVSRAHAYVLSRQHEADETRDHTSDLSSSRHYPEISGACDPPLIPTSRCDGEGSCWDCPPGSVPPVGGPDEPGGCLLLVNSPVIPESAGCYLPTDLGEPCVETASCTAGYCFEGACGLLRNYCP